LLQVSLLKYTFYIFKASCPLDENKHFYGQGNFYKGKCFKLFSICLLELSQLGGTVMKLFSDVANAKNIKIRIGQFVADRVITDKRGKTQVKSPEEINSLDRFDLADQFIEVVEEEAGERFHSDLGDNYNAHILHKDIALFIDITIPKAFNKHYLSRDSYLIEDTGLVYYFEESQKQSELLEEQAKEFRKPKVMTDKQFNYMNKLLLSLDLHKIVDPGYLTLDEASELISFLKSLTSLSEKCRNIILTTKQSKYINLSLNLTKSKDPAYLTLDEAHKVISHLKSLTLLSNRCKTIILT
jgi:hypothetical protein